MTLRPRRHAGGLALAGLVAGAVGVVGPAPVATASSQTAAPQCEVGKTQYASQPSPVLQRLAVPQSWNLATGKGVTVAVVDSGINTGNAHFPEGSVLPGTSLVPGTPPDGRTDVFGHGTAVAGIIGARPIEGIRSGMQGVAYDATLLPVRVFTSDEADAEVQQRPTGALITEGIAWAIDNGADVVNVSLSVGADNLDLPAMREVLARAERQGVVVVASSGDNIGGEEAVTELRFPAAVDTVLGVSALNASGQVDNWSVQGDFVDVAAPGANVLLTYQQYGDCQDGENPLTSWSAPFVAGLAAQLKERFPRATPAEIRYRITTTARRPIANQRDDEQGWGVIQPYDALTVSLDERRPGPVAPDAEVVEAEGRPSEARAITARPDALAPARREALWWWIGGAGLAAVGLLLRPLVRRRAAARDRA